MSLIFHIVRKDIVRLRAWVAVWLLMLALPVAPSFFTEQFAAELNKVGMGGLQHVLQALTAGIVVVLLVQGDSVLGTRAFWRTRPIGAGRLLAAKVAAALTILWGGWMVVGLPWWLWCGWGVSEIARAAFDALLLALVVITPGFVLGALTDSIARAIIWSPILGVYFIWFMPAVAGSMGQYEAQRFFMRTAVAAGATALLLWLALAGFYRGAWSRKSFWFWGVGAVALWMVAGVVSTELMQWGRRREFRPELGRGIALKYEMSSTETTTYRNIEQSHVRAAFSATGEDQQPYYLEGMGATQRWTWGDFHFDRDSYFNRMARTGIPTGFTWTKTDPETTEYWRQKREAASRSTPRLLLTIPNPQDAHLQTYLHLSELRSLAERMTKEPSTFEATLWLTLLRDTIATEVPLSAGSVDSGGDHRVEVRTVSHDAKGWSVVVIDYMPLSWTRELRDTLRDADRSFLYRTGGRYMLLNRAIKESVFSNQQARPRVVYVHGVGVGRKQLDANVGLIARNGVLVDRPEWRSGASLAFVRWETASIFKREVKAEGFLALHVQPLRVERDAGQKK